MSNELYRAERIMARINDLASISDDANGIARTFGTPAFLKGRSKVQEWMQEAGLQTRVDNIGNLRAILPSAVPNAKTFVIASHIDTVINAGKFDGPLGVLMGIDLLEQLIQTKQALPFHIELIAFCDEEGVRFHTTYLGSKVVAGSFDESVLDKKDAAGIALWELIRQIGGDPKKLSQDAIPPNNWLGYFEIHIEQGPVLYERGIPVAVVTAIAGQRRITLGFKGMAGHAGTVPMNMRQDALCCAAECILTIEAFATDHVKDLVATVGKLEVVNAASNVIPGEVTCTLDLRSANEAHVTAAYKFIQTVVADICKRRMVTLTWNLVQQTAPVSCSPQLNQWLAEAVQNTGHELVELVSGAGHDAVPVSAVAPVTMLFVRCYKGISHNPLENTELKDIVATIQVSDNFIQQLIQHHS